MADQEFLASFGVEIDESGLDKLQKALVQNRTLAEELASAFDTARDAVSEFFRQIGLEYYVWPQGAWSKPSGPTNRAILNIDKIRIVRIDKVELDPKKFQLVEGSQKEIPLDSF